jgi:phospholipid/cholesterol/gamma-HCH transport system substrate-binding protein
MASARVNFSVGLFMTAGLGLATLAIIWLGMTSFLRKGELFVTYFDESVQGLNVDSPVKYRGVPVGRVQAIRIAPDFHLIEVVILVDDEHADDENRFDDSVASIANVGITGAMFVEIDKRQPFTDGPSPKLGFTPEYPVIASKPSDIRKLFREIDDIATKIQSIDFKGISDQAMGAFTALNTSVAEARIGDISADIRTLLASINAAANPKRLESLARNMDATIVASRTLMDKATEELTRMDAILAQFQSILETNRPSIDTTMGALATTALKTDAFMTQSQATMMQMQAAIKDLEERLSITAENLEQTSGNLNALISDVKDQPAQLIFGEPKAPRRIEE